MEDKANTVTNKGTSMTRMLNFIGKKVPDRKKRQKKVSPTSSRLQRTFSIHHLECNDYVPQKEVGQTASDDENSNIASGSYSLAISECEPQVQKTSTGATERKTVDVCGGSDSKFVEVENYMLDEHLVLKENIVDARDALLKLKDANINDMASEFAIKSKLLLDSLELFNANREALCGTFEDRHYISSVTAERIQYPTDFRGLTKSASFHGFEFSRSSTESCLERHKRRESDSFVIRRIKSESSGSINVVRSGSVSEGLPGFHELRKRREDGTVQNSLIGFKERVKDSIMINRKEKHRISRDSILHKVPLGHKLPGDTKDKKMLNPRDDPASRKSIQRTWSLTDSLDRYSHLLETLSFNEKAKIPYASKSNRKDSVLLQGKLNRMLSGPVFRSYSLSKAVQSEMSVESSKKNLAGKPLEKNLKSKSFQEETVLLDQGRFSKNLGRLMSAPVFCSNSFSEAAQNELYLESSQFLIPDPPGIMMEKIEDKPKADAILHILEPEAHKHEYVEESDSLFSAGETVRLEKCETRNVESITEMVECTVNPVCIVDDSGYIDPSLYKEGVKEEAGLAYKEETQSEVKSDINSGKANFISPFGPSLVDGASSSIKYLLPKAPELQSESEEEQSQPSNEISADDAFLVQLEDRLFRFVRHTLSRSHRFETLKDRRRLLRDLTEEALTNIYENATAPNPWLLHFHPRIRTVRTAGDHLLRDASADISRHFRAPIRRTWMRRRRRRRWRPSFLDDLLARDLAKNDGWMNLYRHAECVALQMEVLILDDLFDEALAGLGCGSIDF